MAVDVGEARGELTLDISDFTGNMKTAFQDYDSMINRMESATGTSARNIGATLQQVGTAWSVGITQPLTDAGLAIYDVASTFDSNMSAVQAITQSTGDEFNALRETAIQLGQDTVFSSSEVSEAMVNMGKAGWDSTQIINGMSGVLDAASASGERLSTVSTIMADAITNFGLSADESAHVADVLTQAANAGTISISDLGESFKYIGPVANTLGFSFEDVNTALLGMSKSGIKASQAGTSLRGLMDNLVNPTDKCATAMEQLGLEITNSDGSFKSLDEILTQLRGSMSNLTDEQKGYYASVIAGRTGMSGLLSLVNLSQEEYDALAASIDNCGGVAQQTADIMQDNLANDVEQLTGSLESLAIQLMDNVEPYLRKFVQWLEKLVDWFAQLDPSIQVAITAIAALAAAMGPVLIILGGIISGATQVNMALGKITQAFQALTSIPSLLTTIGQGASSAFSLITSPAAIVVAIIGVLIAAFMNLWNTNEGFRNAITEIWTGITETLSTFFQGIQDRLNELGINWQTLIDGLNMAWQTFCSFLAPVFEGAFGVVATVLETVTGVITGLLDIFIGLFTGDWEQFLQGVSEVFGSIWEGICSFLSTMLDTLAGLGEAFCNNFGSLILGGMEAVAGFFESAWNGIVSFLSGVWSNIVSGVSGFIEDILNFFRNLPQNILNAIGNVGNLLYNAGRSIIDGFLNGLRSMWGNVTSFVGGIADWIFSHKGPIQKDRKLLVPAGNAIMEGLGKGITEGFKPIMSDVSNMADDISSAMSGDIGTIPVDFEASVSKIDVTGLSELKDSLAEIYKSTKGIDGLDVNNANYLNVDPINYDKLAYTMLDVMRQAPIENNVEIEMADGDVYLDAEKVGRKVAPTVSRLQSRGVRRIV